MKNKILGAHETAVGACTRPLVTVCIPTVDRLSYLEDAIASVCSQSFDNWEVIVGENSGESTYASAVDEMAIKMPLRGMGELKVLHQGQQLSMVSHLNALVAESRGDYVLILPDDDRLRPSCLEELVAPALEDPTIDVIFCDSWIVGDDGKVDERASQAYSSFYGRDVLPAGRIPDQDLFRLALKQSFILPGMLVRRDLIVVLPFREEMKLISDFDFQLRLAVLQPPPKTVYCASRLFDYRLHAGQASIHRSDGDRIEFYQATIASLLSCGSFPAIHHPVFRRRVANERMALAACYAQTRDFRGWLTQSIAAIWVEPTWPAVYLQFIRRLIPAPIRRILKAARVSR